MVVGYVGYTNSQATHAVDGLAGAAPCEQLRVCGQLEPRSVASTPFERRYQYATAQGDVEVTCRWAYLMVGEVDCVAELDRSRPGPEGKQAYPDAIGRDAKRSGDY